MNERGSGTMTMLATLGVVFTLLLATVTLTHAAVAAAKAAAAADLAALAASDAARGLMAADPCTLAHQTAAEHHAQVTSCQLKDGGVARIDTTVETALPIYNATGEARAGPPEGTPAQSPRR